MVQTCCKGSTWKSLIPIPEKSSGSQTGQRRPHKQRDDLPLRPDGRWHPQFWRRSTPSACKATRPLPWSWLSVAGMQVYPKKKPLFPKQCVHAEGFLVGVKARVRSGMMRALIPGIFPENSRAKSLLSHVHVQFDCEGAQRLSCNFRVKRLLWHLHLHFDCAGSHKMVVPVYSSFWKGLEQVLLKSSRCPYMIWYRSLWEDLVEILLKSSSRSPCIKILKMVRSGSCMKILLGCS